LSQSRWKSSVERGDRAIDLATAVVEDHDAIDALVDPRDWKIARSPPPEGAPNRRSNPPAARANPLRTAADPNPRRIVHVDYARLPFTRQAISR
jgi:hypothetical protein